MRSTAVIDLGSNSFRLVVYAYEPGGPWSLIDEIREPTRISAGMGDERVLRPEPVERAVHTAKAFGAFCRATGIDDVHPVGTSALREARNRDEVVDALGRHMGWPVRILSGEEEGRYGYLAVVNSTTLTEGLTIDMGGGSVQLMCVEDRHLRHAVSLPLGAVRLSERFLPDERARGRQIKALREHVRKKLRKLDWLPDCTGGRLAGLGGSIRNLATATAKAAGEPDLGVQGARLGRTQLDDLVDELAALPASERGGVPGIKLDRGDVILAAALTLQAVMEHGGFEAIEVTEAGLREGVFFEQFLAASDEPLIPDVRRQSVVNLGRRYRFDTAHVDHVAHLSLGIYDEFGELGLHDDDPGERELLWAACELHDIGMAVGYDDHHKHSQYLILNSGLPGFDPRETGLIGLVGRYHRKGDPDVAELGTLARPGDERRLGLLAGIVRVAEQLERARDQSIADVRVTRTGDGVTIEATADGDASVALWSAQRNADLLSEAVGHPVTVRAARAAAV